MWRQELDSTILMGPFQLRLLYESKILSTRTLRHWVVIPYIFSS